MLKLNIYLQYFQTKKFPFNLYLFKSAITKHFCVIFYYIWWCLKSNQTIFYFNEKKPKDTSVSLYLLLVLKKKSLILQVMFIMTLTLSRESSIFYTKISKKKNLQKDNKIYEIPTKWDEHKNFTRAKKQSVFYVNKHLKPSTSPLGLLQ